MSFTVQDPSGSRFRNDAVCSKANSSFHQKKNQQLDKKMTDASGSLGEFTRKYKACQKKVKDAVSFLGLHIARALIAERGAGRGG